MTPFKFNVVTDPPAGSAPPPATPPADDGLDEFGYEKKVAAPPASTPPPAAKTPPVEEEIKDPASGYGKEPLKVEEVPEPPPPPAPIELGYELDVKDVDPAEALKMKEFAKANSLTKEAAQALVNLRRSEFQANAQAQAAQQKQAEKSLAVLKASWDKELREDPNFGGDKFLHNIKKAEKVLGEMLPETKKILTERKSMLPPYVMRDLAKLADHLYKTENFVQGDPNLTDKPEEKETSPLDFYT